MNNIIDCHGHILPQYLQHNGFIFRQILKRCAKQNVIWIVISVDYTEIACVESLLQIAKEYDTQVAVTFGFQPPDSLEKQKGREKELDKALSLAQEMAQKKKIVAIGEIGLDYYWPAVEFLKKQGIFKSTEIEKQMSQNHQQLLEEKVVKDCLQWQKEIFQRCIKLAMEVDFPIVVHERDAYDDVLEVIDKSGIDGKQVMLHCFSQGPEKLQDIENRKYRISLPSSMAYRRPYMDVARVVDLNYVVLETDSPYHSPILGLWKKAFQEASHQAKESGVSKKAFDREVKQRKQALFEEYLRQLPDLSFEIYKNEQNVIVPAKEYFQSSNHRRTNEQSFIRSSAIAFADLQKKDLETICQATTTNARNFYGLPKENI